MGLDNTEGLNGIINLITHVSIARQIDECLPDYKKGKITQYY